MSATKKEDKDLRRYRPLDNFSFQPIYVCVSVKFSDINEHVYACVCVCV